MLRKLDHQNIVRCYWDSLNPVNKEYSFAMEYMPGEKKLSSLIKFSNV